MSEATDRLRAYTTLDREAAASIQEQTNLQRYLAAVGEQGATADQARALADAVDGLTGLIEEMANGWEEIASAADAAVDDPDLH